MSGVKRSRSLSGKRSRRLLQAILERRSGRRDIRLHTPTWTSLWRCNVRLVERYRQGRVFLAGDAAHIHSPAGGQGMNTGIQDAHNLAWKLAAGPKLLDTYEAERRPIAEHVLAMSNAKLADLIAGTLVAIRPDGYIGLISDAGDRDALTRYCEVLRW